MIPSQFRCRKFRTRQKHEVASVLVMSTESVPFTPKAVSCPSASSLLRLTYAQPSVFTGDQRYSVAYTYTPATWAAEAGKVLDPRLKEKRQMGFSYNFIHMDHRVPVRFSHWPPCDHVEPPVVCSLSSVSYLSAVWSHCAACSLLANGLVVSRLGLSQTSTLDMVCKVGAEPRAFD